MGNLLTKTDGRGVTTNYNYDVLNRITQVQYVKSGSATQTLAYQYDQGTNGLGHLTNLIDDNGSIGWRYDIFGHITARIQTINGSIPVNLGMQIQYDSAGRPQQVTYPSGHVVGYSYDTLGHINQINVDGAAAISGIAWQSFGPVYDKESGLNYNFQRSYDPSIGRYTQSDPIGLNGGVSTYAYANGSPVSLIDQRGQWATVVAVAIGTVAVYEFYHFVNEKAAQNDAAYNNYYNNIGTNASNISDPNRISLNNAADAIHEGSKLEGAVNTGVKNIVEDKSVLDQLEDFAQDHISEFRDYLQNMKNTSKSCQ